MLNNIRTIQHILQISSSSVLSAAPYFQHQTQKLKGCQVDLLIQCSYTVYVCEVKLRKKITSEVIEEVREKISRLGIPKGISIRPVLIYEGELSPQIIRANFFAHFISFDQLLNPASV